MSLVEIKAVDAAYPLVGAVASEPAMPLPDAFAERGGVFGALADPTLSARLDLEAGGRISVGAATFEIRGVLRNEPDKLAGGIGFGPRLLISDAGLRATGLVQPGSLVRWLLTEQPAGPEQMALAIHVEADLPGNDVDDLLVGMAVRPRFVLGHQPVQRHCRAFAGEGLALDALAHRRPGNGAPVDLVCVHFLFSFAMLIWLPRECPRDG